MVLSGSSVVNTTLSHRSFLEDSSSVCVCFTSEKFEASFYRPQKSHGISDTSVHKNVEF